MTENTTKPAAQPVIVRSREELKAQAKTGAVIQAHDGAMFLVGFDRAHPTHFPSFKRLTVKVKKRGLQVSRRYALPYGLFPAAVLYSPPADITLPTRPPEYYLPDGTPNPDQFVKQAAPCPAGFTKMPTDDLRRGTVIELAVGGYAVLPAGYRLNDRDPYFKNRLYMRRIKKNLQLGQRTAYWRPTTYGGVRVVWEPDVDLAGTDLPVSFNDDGIPTRVALLEEHLAAERAPALFGGVL